MLGISAVVCNQALQVSKSESCQRRRNGEDEGPNNIARLIAQMTRRFGNAEKDPSAPDYVHMAPSAELVWKVGGPISLDNV
jgi:hypothetical protein